MAVAAGAAAWQVADRERQYRERMSSGDLALRDGQTFGAIESYSGALAWRPDSMLAHLRRGEAYRQRSEFDAAARDFRDAAELDPSAPRPLEALGEVLYQRGRYTQAADAYEARLKLDERSADTWYKLALARYRAGQIDHTLDALDQVAHLNDSLPDAYLLRGMCQRDKGQIGRAHV